MKLSELFEAAQYDDSRIKIYTADQIKSLPSISPDNVDDAYGVGHIAFDNAEGLGSTPMGQNILYQGFVAIMKASDFLKLATKADRSEDANRIVGKIRDGAAIATPFLEFQMNPEYEDGEPLTIKIKGHEGRARVNAIIKTAGDINIPVQFFGRGGLKARDYNPKFFTDFRSTFITSQDGDKIEPKLQAIFWNGQRLNK